MGDFRLGFLVSHGGTNMQAIIDACKEGRLDAVPCVVISNNSGAMALERARREDVPWYHLSQQTHPSAGALDQAMTQVMERHGVNLVVMAGYMLKIGPFLLARYAGRIVNVHPALLPRHGGKGMYGERVHEAVLAAGDEITGVTIHLVDAQYDHGAILAQREAPVLPDDTVESLRQRVLAVEHQLYAETLQRIAIGEINLPGL